MAAATCHGEGHAKGNGFEEVCARACAGMVSLCVQYTLRDGRTHSQRVRVRMHGISKGAVRVKS